MSRSVTPMFGEPESRVAEGVLAFAVLAPLAGGLDATWEPAAWRWRRH